MCLGGGIKNATEKTLDMKTKHDAVVSAEIGGSLIISSGSGEGAQWHRGQIQQENQPLGSKTK